VSPRSQALLIGIGTFVVAMAICVAIFVALDVRLLFLTGPAIGVGFAAYMAYQSALRDAPKR